MSNPFGVPTPHPIDHRAVVLDAALTLAGQGRAVFLLGRTKRPVGNCPPCRTANADHDSEALASETVGSGRSTLRW